MSAGDVSKASVLDCLEAFQRSLTVVRKNNWSRVVKKGADQGLKRQSEALFVVPKGGVGEGPQDIQPTTGFPSDVGGMGRECPGWVKNDSK